VKYELDFYIPEDGIIHSDRRENLKSYGKNIGYTDDEAGGIHSSQAARRVLMELYLVQTVSYIRRL
jgi:hypothetical protein